MPLEWLKVVRFLHLFFAFLYVGSLILTEWNGRAARLSDDWAHRSLLFRSLFLSSLVAGLGGLVLSGVIGNVLSVAMGYSMAMTRWLQWANALWLLAVLLMGFLTIPAAARLARGARVLADAAETPGPALREYSRVLLRWRVGNVVQSILFLALLALMVFRWGS